MRAQARQTQLEDPWIWLGEADFVRIDDDVHHVREMIAVLFTFARAVKAVAEQGGAIARAEGAEVGNQLSGILGGNGSTDSGSLPEGGGSTDSTSVSNGDSSVESGSTDSATTGSDATDSGGTHSGGDDSGDANADGPPLATDSGTDVLSSFFVRYEAESPVNTLTYPVEGVATDGAQPCPGTPGTSSGPPV